jgi:hypothetical protein
MSKPKAPKAVEPAASKHCKTFMMGGRIIVHVNRNKRQHNFDYHITKIDEVAQTYNLTNKDFGTVAAIPFSSIERFDGFYPRIAILGTPTEARLEAIFLDIQNRLSNGHTAKESR